MKIVHKIRIHNALLIYILVVVGTKTNGPTAMHLTLSVRRLFGLKY